MATELLLCETCNDHWEREVKRGRKPKECPDCKAGTKKSNTKEPANPEALKQAEKQYKQRVQMQGKYFKALGESSIFVTTRGKELTIFKSFELDDGVVHQGNLVRQKGLQGRYKVRSLAVREDGTAYVNLIGVSGTYEGKHRALGVDQITL